MSFATKYPVADYRRQRGISLVEIMVALVIGLVVVGAVLVSYVGSGQSTRLQSAFAEMNDNAQVALTLLSRDLLNATYNSVGSVNTAANTRPFAPRQAFASATPLLACANGFNNAAAAAGAETCAGGTGNASIQIAYEADTTNTLTTDATGSAYSAVTCVLPQSGVPAANVAPTDCAGNGLYPVNPAAGAGNACVFHAYNRYFINQVAGKSNLSCVASPFNGGARASQPLVENIETMQFTFGVADTLPWAATASAPSQAVRYLSIADVAGSPPVTPSLWANVVSVRVCVLVSSSEAVFDSTSNSYLDCNSTTQQSADRRARRTYTTTVSLRNRMGF